MDDWLQVFNELKAFVETHKRMPEITSANRDEIRLCSWFVFEKRDYYRNVGVFPENSAYKVAFESFIDKLST